MKNLTISFLLLILGVSFLTSCGSPEKDREILELKNKNLDLELKASTDSLTSAFRLMAYTMAWNVYQVKGDLALNATVVKQMESAMIKVKKDGRPLSHNDYLKLSKACAEFALAQKNDNLSLSETRKTIDMASSAQELQNICSALSKEHRQISDERDRITYSL